MLKTVFAKQSRYLPSFLWLLLLYALVILALLGTGEEKFEHLHLILDISNAILSLLLMLFLLGEQHQIQPNVREYLVIGFGFAAATELLHALIGIEWSGWFAWVQIYSGTLRPATWPPSTYLLPLAMAWAFWLMRRNSTLRPALFAAGIALLTAGLLALSLVLPRYVDTGILGIQRPTQVPLLLLWVGVIAVYWRERRTHPLYEGLALMGALLFLSDLCMLYSTSPHEKFTMMAHAGKMIAYTLLHVIQMRIAAEDSRGRSAAESALLLEKERLQIVLDELALHNQVLQQISLGVPLPKVLDELARQVEALHPGMLCSILLVDEGGKHLRHGAAPGLPDFYNQAVNGLAIGDGIGACGTAASRGERVIVEDVQQHTYWPEPYRDLARRAGVQSCWSQPIKNSNGRVLGTFAIYHQKPALPSDTEIALIERYADLTALVIERIRIQDDLRESEQRFRQLAENIREVFWMTDPAKNKMLYISPAYEQIWGRTLQSLYDSPRAWLEAIHGEDRQRVLQAALTKQAVGLYDEEYRIVRPNGDVRWIHDRAFPVRDSGGTVYRIVGVAEDITERRLAENETKEAQERFEMIFNASPDTAVISRLQDGCITNINDAFTKLSGYTMGEAIGSSTIGLSLWVNHGDREKFINELRTKGVCENLEAQFQSKDGKQYTGLLSAKSTFLHGIWHIISITRDITERKQIEDKLAESERHFRAVTESANDAIITGADDGNIVGWNAAAERVFGYTEAEIIGQPLTALMPERFRNLHSAGLARVVAGGTPHLIGKTVEVFGLRKDGSEFQLELSLAQWQAAAGKFFNAIIRDITERKQTEFELRIAATVFESQEGMAITDANNVILRVNRAFTEITGYTAEEAVGQTPNLLNSGRHDAAFYAAMWESIQHTGAWQGEIWNQRKNGEVYPEQLTITAVKGNTGEVTNYVATLHDITQRKAAEEQIYTLAFYDALTQLPNRRLLNDRLGKAMATSKRSGHYGALMFLDLDNFKPLNDTHGHGVGDLLLIDVAHRLTSCVREVDTVARFGGDEFVVLLGELDMDKAESIAQAGIIAEKIRSTLAKPYRLKIQQEGKAEITVEHHCAASIGVVVFNSEASMEDILKWADAAMYQAKERGRNQVNFFDSKF